MTDSPEQRATYLVRSQILERISHHLHEAAIPTLLVKGAGLALSVYQRPWQRSMSDVDLMVPEGDMDAAVEALDQAGFQRVSYDDPRWLTTTPVDERALVYRAAGTSWLVEVHSRMDPLFGRPVDYPAVFRRAVPAAGYAGLSVPSHEDHALLVILHAAASEFRHEPCWLDLALLLRAGLDEHALVLRAKQWRMATIAFVAFSTLATMPDAPAAAGRLADRLEPSRSRLMALRPWYKLGGYPLHPRGHELGLPWMLRQTLLRDDFPWWLSRVARYAVVRAVERATGT